jgi:serine/threonine-protein kinase
MKPQYCSQGHLNSVDSRFCRLCGESLTGGSAQVVAGQLLGWRYRIVSELAQGGFGRTYLVQDTHRFDEPCVLKEFAPQVQGQEALRKAEELFAREAGILYQLEHPQIPEFRELFRAEWQGRERLFLVQDFVDGQTYQDLLHDRQQQSATFTEVEVKELLFQLLPVLDYIHRAGVIHRDISPDNLIRRSSDGLPILIDFGGVKQVAARAISESAPQANGRIATMTRLGKLGYAPPEQLEQGEVSPHSDLYALAVTVLVLLTGKEPQDLFFANGGLNRRGWQQVVSLTPTLTQTLDRMLDPYPEKRYQSAQEVLQALTQPDAIQAKPPRSAPAPKASVFAPIPNLIQSATSMVKTIAVGRSRAKTQAAQATPKPASAAQPLQWKEMAALVKWLVVGGMIVGGWWVGVKWLGPALKEKLPEITHSMRPPQTNNLNNSAVAKPQETEFSKAEQVRKQKLAQRLHKLGVDDNFVIGLVNELFYAQHPELNGQTLGTGAAEENLRAEWDQIALQVADRLQSLSPVTRSRLGQYSEADLRNRQAILNQLNLSSRAANDLTDAQFFHLFPDQSRTDNLLNQPIGQVWQAIAADQLKSLQSGETLEQVRFPTDNFSHRLNGTLKPGEAKAFLARFNQNQTFRLQLQVPVQSVRVSLYPPSSKSPALLEDSQETSWSGKLKETGLYEITLVSDTTQSISYAIDLAATNDTAAF